MRKYLAQFASRIVAKGRFRELQRMHAYEYRPLEECRRWQRSLLYSVLKYSVENSPYYQKIARERSITLTEDGITEELAKFPVLTKDIIINERERIKVGNFKKAFFRDTTGGTTGEPVMFYKDVCSKESRTASSLLFYEWAGRREGEKLVKLWGSEKEILTGSKGARGWISRYILNTTTLNAFRMTPDTMRHYVSVINREKPKVIEAYVQSLYELAKFIEANHLPVFSPKGIIVSAGTLYPPLKEAIERVFKAKVYNRYGSREVGGVACSCEKDEGLHINIFTSYIEILNDRLELCPPEELGGIYITTLTNYVMPLIRYKIGDLGAWSKIQHCSCGRGLPLLRRVEGREMNVFRTRSGRIIPGEFFIHFIGVVFNKNYISKFQVIQEDYDLVIIKVVISDEAGFVRYQDDIVASIRTVMGADCRVKFERVANIEPAASGKYHYTISKLK